MHLTTETLHKALELLGQLMEHQNTKPASLVVCGGSALLATGLVQRVTKDVDVVAFIDRDGRICSSELLPNDLMTAASMVADELGLNSDWLNNGPWMLVNDTLNNQGLPDGFVGRLIWRHYGTRLTIYFISRLDQIHFKLFAAADKGGPSYHLDDLHLLKPTVEEIEQASKWALTQDPSSAFADTLRAMLEAIGYGQISRKI